MLSFSKLLLLIVVFVLVFFGWRWLKRVEAVGRERLRERGARPAPRRPGGAPRDTGGGGGGPGAGAADVEDLEKCPECGAYVAPRSAVSCGRAGCPYGR